MKPNAKSLLVGACLTVLLFAANIPMAVAGTRSTTAFGAFHVQSATVLSENAYLCLTEDNGAVVNDCTYPVNLQFNLPIDNNTNDKSHTISVQDYWKFPTGDSFNCVSYGYTGLQSSSNQGTQITFTGAGQLLKTTTTVPNNTGGLFGSLTVICWQVPPHAGVANLNWW